jgi:glycosyltransferase involved in cell wall biosynthesis
MPSFLEDKTYVMSLSATEGIHTGVLEAMACGCKPIVGDWIGSNDVYPNYALFRNFSEINRLFSEPEYEPEKYRQYILDNYNAEVLDDLLIKEITGGE